MLHVLKDSSVVFSANLPFYLALLTKMRVQYIGKSIMDLTGRKCFKKHSVTIETVATFTEHINPQSNYCLLFS